MARTEKKPRPPKARAAGIGPILEELFSAQWGGLSASKRKQLLDGRCSDALSKRNTASERNFAFLSILEGQKVDQNAWKIALASVIGTTLHQQEEQVPLVNDEEMAEGVRRLLEANDKPKQVVPIQTATIEQPPQAIPGDAEEWVG